MNVFAQWAAHLQNECRSRFVPVWDSHREVLAKLQHCTNISYRSDEAMGMTFLMTEIPQENEITRIPGCPQMEFLFSLLLNGINQVSET